MSLLGKLESKTTSRCPHRSWLRNVSRVIKFLELSLVSNSAVGEVHVCGNWDPGRGERCRVTVPGNRLQRPASVKVQICIIQLQAFGPMGNELWSSQPSYCHYGWRGARLPASEGTSVKIGESVTILFQVHSDIPLLCVPRYAIGHGHSYY